MNKPVKTKIKALAGKYSKAEQIPLSKEHMYEKYEEVYASKPSRFSSSTQINIPLEAPIEVDIEKLVEDVASSIENIIADFLPDSDKQLPVDIAKAVITELLQSKSVSISELDMKYYQQAEQTVANALHNMTMAEYAKLRPQLLGRLK
jgi:hypothetical protein